MSNHKELLERISAASGPDRELDADLAEALGIRVEREHFARYTQAWAPFIYDWMGCTKHPLPDFTASIDSALALVERTLPECAYRLQRNLDTSKVWCSLQKRGTDEPFEIWVDVDELPTAPIAVLAALLTALIAQHAKDARE